ncbi:hypothetical protein BC830DRAFT_480176 [Chytriomyces sp. MP71]|nr:hypothetical protein BC830DRAFT_480176 [Chytriomyces sp. MP71]
MMWHSHMLNPLRFLEDCFFIFGSTPPHNFPLARMYALPPNEYNPQDGSREVWESWTHGEPFEINPLDPPRPFNFLCSWCKEMFEVEPDLFVEYRMKDGKVFCGACGACSTAESVSVKRFLADVDQLHSNKRVLMGTALDDKGCVDVWTARKDLEIVIPPSGHFLLMAHDSSLCSWVMMESILKPHLQSLYKSGALKQFAVRKATFPRMFKAYKHIPIPLSLDLVGAVLRQREFTTKMVSGIIDWGQRDSLPRATLRYRDFLNLMAKQRKAFLVPTLDIDLMWHTHQLHPLKYQTFGLLEVGYVINHDDAVEADTLNKSFAQTNLLWKNCYNEPYAAQREESSWFRRPIEAQKKPIGRVVPVNTVPDGRLRGACVLHDPSARTSYARRSNKKYPISKEPGYAVLVIGGAVTATGACSSCVAACAHWRKYGFEFHPAGPGSHIFGSDFWGGCGGGATFSCGGGSASVTPASRGGFDSSSFSTLRPTHGHHTSLGSTNAGISNSSFDAGSGAAHSHSHHSGHSHSHHSGPSHSHHSGLSHSHHSGHSHSHHSGLSHSHHSAHGGGGHH